MKQQQRKSYKAVLMRPVSLYTTGDTERKVIKESKKKVQSMNYKKTMYGCK